MVNTWKFMKIQFTYTSHILKWNLANKPILTAISNLSKSMHTYAPQMYNLHDIRAFNRVDIIIFAWKLFGCLYHSLLQSRSYCYKPYLIIIQFIVFLMLLETSCMQNLPLRELSHTYTLTYWWYVVLNGLPSKYARKFHAIFKQFHEWFDWKLFKFFAPEFEFAIHFYRIEK